MAFNEWLNSRGIEWPNLGINMPAGMAWPAAEILIREYRLWKESTRQFERLLDEVLNSTTEYKTN